MSTDEFRAVTSNLKEKEERAKSTIMSRDFFDNSKTYQTILEHRRNCDKWMKEFCLDCFGGGLTQFISKLDDEAFYYVRNGRNSRRVVDE